MTWFRVGGAGIPATLKNAMNAVFNKKFGTSGQNYPPKQWPDDVNLLGPLPEGTASGPIANFSDGADRVPTKNVIATIAPTLTGVSSVAVVHTGKNLLDPSIVYSQTTIYTYDSTTGAVTVNNSDTSAWSTKEELPLKKGTYSINNPQGRVQYRLKSENYETDHNINASSGTITLSDDDCIKFKFGLGSTYPFTASYQLEVGSTVTTFEKYTAPTVSTVNLGRLIHGGTADLVNGVGQSTHKIYTAADVTGLYWNNRKVDQVDNNHRATFRIAITSGYITQANSLCNDLTYSASITGGSGYIEGYQIVSTAGIYFCIDLADIGMENATSDTPNQDFLDAIHEYGDNLKFAIELSTSTDFTFEGQKINSRYGVNNFWNNAGGDTMAVYRRDIDLALQAVSSSRGLMMASRPVTQLVGEQADLDQVNELNEEAENTEEQEGEDDAR